MAGEAREDIRQFLLCTSGKCVSGERHAAFIVKSLPGLACISTEGTKRGGIQTFSTTSPGPLPTGGGQNLALAPLLESGASFLVGTFFGRSGIWRKGGLVRPVRRTHSSLRGGSGRSRRRRRRLRRSITGLIILFLFSSPPPHSSFVRSQGFSSSPLPGEAPPPPPPHSSSRLLCLRDGDGGMQGGLEVFGAEPGEGNWRRRHSGNKEQAGEYAVKKEIEEKMPREHTKYKKGPNAAAFSPSSLYPMYPPPW